MLFKRVDLAAVHLLLQQISYKMQTQTNHCHAYLDFGNEKSKALRAS